MFNVLKKSILTNFLVKKNKYKYFYVHYLHIRTGDNMENLEELKKKFIVDKEHYEEEQLGKHVDKISKYCKTDSEGNVHIEVQNLTNKEKIKLVLVARFIANKLKSDITPEVNIKTVSDSVHKNEHQVRARLSEIVREGFIRQKKRGVYIVMPHRIDEFLDQMDTIYKS